MKTYYYEFHDSVGEVEVTVECQMVPGSPGCGPTYSHGGLPPEPCMVEDMTLTVRGTKENADHLLTDKEFERLSDRACAEWEGPYYDAPDYDFEVREEDR